MAVKVNLTWRGREYSEALMAELQRRMRAAGSQSVSSIQAKLSTPYPPAAPIGQLPHRRTGALRAGMVGDVVRTGQTKVELTVGRRLPPYAAAALAKHDRASLKRTVVNAVKRQLRVKP